MDELVTKMSFAQVAKAYLSTIANKKNFSLITNMRVASVSTGGYYGLVVVTPPRPRPRPQTLHHSHDNLKNPYRIASIFYM